MAERQRPVVIRAASGPVRVVALRIEDSAWVEVRGLIVTGGKSLPAAWPDMPARAAAIRPVCLETAAKSAARAIGSQVGREIIRGVLGSILGGRSR